MRTTAAARRYGKALFSLATDEGRVEAVRDELAGFASLVDSSQELADALLTPLWPVAQRRKVLDALAERLGTSPTVRNFFDYLIDQRRLIAFPAIREEYERLCDEASGRTVAEIVSARPLDEQRQRRLQEALARRTGKHVSLDVTVDESLLGGAIAKVGGVVFDGSLRTQLAQLRGNLTKGS